MRGRIVYSTGPSGAAGEAKKPRGESSDSAPPASQSVHARIERSGRGGKTVTVAGPFLLSHEDAAALLALLKKRCGTGGTARHGETPQGRPCFFLEVQGDHVAGVLGALAGRGFRVER